MTLALCVKALSELCEYRAQGKVRGETLAQLLSMWRLRAEICAAQERTGGGGTPVA